MGNLDDNNYIYILADSDDEIFLNDMNKENMRIFYSYLVKAIIISIIIILSSVIITTSVSTYYTLNYIVDPIKELARNANDISNGDLSERIIYKKDDEFKKLFDDFENMRLTLLKSKNTQEIYNQNRKQLIAGITHDLNTPLTSIKGYTRGLIDNIADTEEKRQNYIKKIDKTASEMKELIDQLFLYSKLDVDKEDFNFVKTNVTDYFNDCVVDLKPMYKSRGLDINLYNELNYATFINIDLIHFQRVILNIINNSLKYKKKDIGRLDIYLEEKIDNIVIRFKDNGIGIEEETHNEIFDVFFRIDKSRNLDTGGSGLGLAIAKSIIDAHNGKIYVNKHYGEGLELIIELPKGEII